MKTAKYTTMTAFAFVAAACPAACAQDRAAFA